MENWYEYDFNDMSWGNQEKIQELILVATGWQVKPFSDDKFLLADPYGATAHIGRLHDIRRVVFDSFVIPQYTEDLLAALSLLDEQALKHAFGYELFEWRDQNLFKLELTLPNLEDAFLYVQLPIFRDIGTTKAYAYSIITLMALQAYYRKENPTDEVESNEEFDAEVY